MEPQLIEAKLAALGYGPLIDPHRPWTSAHRLDDLSLWYDWDSVASMIATLRIYLFEHGAVPVWNFLICGGKPELASPFNWAFTWPSLFAYALPPNHAIVAVWLLMTLVGFVAMRSLLLRWTGDALGAGAGAVLWAVNGYFATRFNIGHVTFAFFHLVPVLMLVYERSLAAILARERLLAPLIVTILASFLFFTAGLPHALLHLYGAFALLVAVRAVQVARSSGLRVSLRATGLLTGAHLLGGWLAAYKLWPVMQWQLLHPRGDVRTEAYGLALVIRSTLDFVPDYYGDFWPEPWHVYPIWEYGAFIGAVPWLLALFVAAQVALRRFSRKQHEAAPMARDAVVLGFLFLAAGVSLSLGNAHPAGPARWFSSLPFFEGIRAFSRYQILTILGLCVLSAHGIAWLTSNPQVSGPGRPWRWLVAASAVAPVLFQGGVLVWNLHAVPNEDILSRYGVSARPRRPQLVAIQQQVARRTFHQTALLEAGYWLATCRGSMNLPDIATPQPLRRWPLSNPAPLDIDALHASELTLRYASAKRGRVRLHLRVLENFAFDPPPIAQPGDSVVFRRADLREGAVTVHASYPGPAAGAYASLAGLVVTAVFLLMASRARPTAPRR